MNPFDAHLGAVEQDSPCEHSSLMEGSMKHKLCSLKDISPGTVVQLPKEYQSREDETAIVLGLELASDKKRIKTGFLRKQDDRLITTWMPTQPEDTELVLAEDEPLKKASIEAFVGNKLALPTLGMSTGCDPEIFVVHGDGSVFPAWEYMPSEDEARLSAKEWLKLDWSLPDNTPSLRQTSMEFTNWADPAAYYCPVKVPAYWDGAQAEFAPWAKNCLETLHYGTRAGLQAVLEFARAKDPTARLTLKNVVELPEQVLKNAENKYIQFRCSRSYNIYNDPGDGIQNAREYPFRCAGGHIHIGYSRRFTAPGIEQIVRGLDGVLGVAGVSLAAGIDNPERRNTYGRAGEFRLPSHGLEYRVLSNFWLCHPAISMLVFEIARAAVRLAESGLFNLCWVADEGETREVINNCDVDGARTILKRNKAVLSGLFNAMWQSDGSITLTEELASKMRTLALKTLLNGMEAAIPDPFDIEKNWKLNKPDEWKRHCRGIGDSWKSLSEGVKL
jgi:hypothetical protein